MSRSRQVLGWVATVLGTLGFLACLAALAGVWVLNHRLQSPVAETFDKVVAMCGQLEDRTEQVADRIQSSRDAVHELDTRIEQRARELLDLSAEDVEKLEELYVRLRSTIQRVGDWMAFADATVSFVEQVMDIAGAAVGYVKTDSTARSGLVSALASGHEQIEEAGRLLDEVDARLLDVRAHGNTKIDAAQIETLSSRIDSVLAPLQEHAIAFSVGVLGLGEAAAELQGRIRRGMLVCAVVLTVLLLWQAAAQAALARVGWTFARSDARVVDGEDRRAGQEDQDAGK